MSRRIAAYGCKSCVPAKALKEGLEPSRPLCQRAKMEPVALLAYATVALALFTAILALQGFNANKNAERLYRLQSEDLRRRESRDQPNLQLFDVRLDPTKNASSLTDQPLLVELMNFGGRPARIISATFRMKGRDAEEASAWDSNCVRSQELVRFELSTAVRKLMAAAWSQAAQAVKTGESTPESDTTGELTVTYSEIDGADSRTARFIVPVIAYRSTYTRPDFTYTVVRDEA